MDTYSYVGDAYGAVYMAWRAVDGLSDGCSCFCIREMFGYLRVLVPVNDETIVGIIRNDKRLITLIQRLLATFFFLELFFPEYQ